MPEAVKNHKRNDINNKSAELRKFKHEFNNTK